MKDWDGCKRYTKEDCILMMEKLYDMGWTDEMFEQMKDMTLQQAFDLVEGKTQA